MSHSCVPHSLQHAELPAVASVSEPCQKRSIVLDPMFLVGAVREQPKKELPDLKALQGKDREIVTVIRLQSRSGKGKGTWLSLPQNSSYKKHELQLCLDKGVLMYLREHFLVWVVPFQICRLLIYWVHDTPFARQQGTDKTTQGRASVGWWPLMKVYVQQYCENCLVCEQNNPSSTRRNAPL